MPRPNLSSLISKFVFRETLTTEDKTTIRGDIGAEAAGAAATVQVLAANDATTKANAASAAATAALAIETAARIAADATKQPLAAALTAYAADPTAAILANMPDALTYAGDDPNGFSGTIQEERFTVSSFGAATGTLMLSTTVNGVSASLPVALVAATHTSASLIAEAIRTAVDASAFFGSYVITRSSATVIIRRLVAAADDSTLQLSLPFTSLGVTAATSVSTTPGDSPVAALTGAHLGQLCRASTAWWIWNGTAWIPFATLDGSPIAYNATLSAYRKLTVSGADGSEIITISAL